MIEFCHAEGRNLGLSPSGELFYGSDVVIDNPRDDEKAANELRVKEWVCGLVAVEFFLVRILDQLRGMNQ